MPVTVQWVNDQQTTILLDMTPPWQWSDLRLAAIKAADMIERVDFSVDLIVDAAHVAPIPQRDAIIHGQWIASIWPHNYAGRVVVVTQQPLLIAIVAVFRRLQTRLATRLITTSTLEEAYTLLGITP